MPCTDGGPITSYENPETRRRLDAATRAACSVFKVLTKEQLASLPGSARAWWVDHEEADRRREAAEQARREQSNLRARALDKLTPAEKKALGFPI